MWRTVSGSISFAFLTLLHVAATAEETIPCDPYAVGNMWKYSETNTLGESEVRVLVMSNESGEIMVSEESHYSFNGNSQEQTQTLHEEDGAIVLKAVSMQDGLVNIEMDMLLCGSPDPQVSFLGSEEVNVPAGSFDAQVFEIIREGGPGEGGQMAPGNQWVTVYYVPGIGTVKTVMVIEVMTPVMPQVRQSSDDSAALIQEGIAAMQEGKDASEIFEKLAQTSQPTAGEKAEIRYKMEKNTLTRELVEYAIE